MWWKNLLWGYWNGITAWLVLIVHLFGKWREFPVYDTGRKGGWYNFGFVVGASSTILGSSGRKRGQLAKKGKGKA